MDLDTDVVLDIDMDMDRSVYHTWRKKDSCCKNLSCTNNDDEFMLHTLAPSVRFFQHSSENRRSPAATLRYVFSALPSRKGCFPVKRMCARQPRLHMSTGFSVFFFIQSPVRLFVRWKGRTDGRTEVKGMPLVFIFFSDHVVRVTQVLA